MSNAYTLDKRFILQVKSTARDELNQPVDVWVNVLPGDGKRWAWIKDLTGRQYLAAGGTQNAVQTEIGMRHCAGIVPSMRVLHGAVVYDIEAVLERDRHWTVLMCSKGGGNG